MDTQSQATTCAFIKELNLETWAFVICAIALPSLISIRQFVVSSLHSVYSLPAPPSRTCLALSIIQVAVWPFDNDNEGDQLRLWNLAIEEHHWYGALCRCGDTTFYGNPLLNGAPIIGTLWFPLIYEFISSSKFGSGSSLQSRQIKCGVNGQIYIIIVIEYSSRRKDQARSWHQSKNTLSLVSCDVKE